jgi:hypothetical protein
MSYRKFYVQLWHEDANRFFYKKNEPQCRVVIEQAFFRMGNFHLRFDIKARSKCYDLWNILDPENEETDVAILTEITAISS